MIQVTRPAMPSLEEYIEEISELWESRWLTNMGIKHQMFEKQLGTYLGMDNTVLFVNGHMALELLLQALNLHGEVITTPYTFASTTHAIVRNGLTPVFCDIDPVTFTIDPSKIEKLITDRTCAILPVHVYGNICDVEEIDRIAKKYELKVVYDAAHAFGETYKGKGIGCYGDASIFSFHATKVFNTIEGGAVSFKDPALETTLKDLKNFGFHGYEEVCGVGANAKMNEFCAAMGLCNLRHIDEVIRQRGLRSDRYRERLQGIEGLQLNPVQADVTCNYSYFPIVVEEALFGASRSEIFTMLQEHDIMARKYFYPLTSAFDCFHRQYDILKTPVALHVSKRVLTLPLYADLPMEKVDEICDLILSCRK